MKSEGKKNIVNTYQYQRCQYDICVKKKPIAKASSSWCELHASMMVISAVIRNSDVTLFLSVLLYILEKRL